MCVYVCICVNREYGSVCVYVCISVYMYVYVCVYVCAGGETGILPHVSTGYPKTTNPQFNVLLWLQEVPIGSTVITSIHEKVQAPPDVPAVTFCHGTAKVNPWSWNLDVKESLGHASGCWIDLPPQTKIENDRGPVLNVTCKILEPSCRTPDVDGVWRSRRRAVWRSRRHGNSRRHGGAGNAHAQCTYRPGGPL